VTNCIESLVGCNGLECQHVTNQQSETMRTCWTIKLLLAGWLLFTAPFAIAAPRQEPPPPGTPFTGRIKVSFYAIEPGLYAKAPAELLTNPTKLLGFFQRSSKERKTVEVLTADVSIQAGEGKLESAVVEKVVSGDLVRLGFFVSMPAVREDGATIRIQHEFKWSVLDKHRGGVGGSAKSAKSGDGGMKFLCVQSQLQFDKGGTGLAGEWRSEIPPPEVKPGGAWHYLLFYSLP